MAAGKYLSLRKFPFISRKKLAHIQKQVSFGLSLFSCLLFSVQGSYGQVVSDGRTATSITGSGPTLNVTTTTISQGHGVNSFSQFDVNSSQTVNLHAPSGTQGTLNIINGSQSTINGVVQSMQGGQVGGALYIANSNGFVVGPQGIIRGGSVSLSTPSQSALNGVFGPGGQLSSSHVRNLINGTAPLGNGDISVDGRIEAATDLSLRSGGQMRINGALNAGNGIIRIEGRHGVELQGGARLNARNGQGGGGEISVRSDGDILVRSGARVLSQSTGSQAAGKIYIFSQESALLESGAVISAAAFGAGTGGFVEFSARNTVEAFGELEAYSVAGEGGQILIDPLVLEIGDMNSNGADLTLVATDRIRVLEGSVITSAGGTGAGDITLFAPQIELLAGSVISAMTSSASDNANSGDVTIIARADDRLTDEAEAPGDVAQNALPIGSVNLTVTAAIVRGKNVTLGAMVFKDNIIDTESAASAYSEALFGPDGALVESEQLQSLASSAATKVQKFLDEIDIANQPMFLSAKAKVVLDGSYIVAMEKAVVISSATTHMEIAPANQNMAFAIAASNTEAYTLVHNTAIEAGNEIEVKSIVTEEHTLVGKSGVQDDDVDATAFNIAIAASLRRSRAMTIVNGPRQPIAFDPSANTTSSSPFIPWNPVNGHDEYATLISGGSIAIASENVKNIVLQSDAVVNGEAKGIALALSVDDSRTETRLGGYIVSQSGQVDVSAQTRFERFATRARVSGGSEAAANVAAAAADQSISTEDQQKAAPIMLQVAADAGETGNPVGGALDAIGGGGSGSGSGDNDSRLAIALNLSAHRLNTVATAGDPDFTYEAPDGTVTHLNAPGIKTTPNGSYGRFGGQFYADASKVDLSENPQVLISARNLFKDIRVESQALLGSIPNEDPEAAGDLTGKSESELAADGDRAIMVAVTVAYWDANAEVLLDGGGVLGYNGVIRSVSDAGLLAENVFEETEGRDTVDTWWNEYRETLVQTEGDSNEDETDSDAADGTADEAGDTEGSVRQGRKGRIGKAADGTTASLTGEQEDDAADDADETAAPPATTEPADADEEPAATPIDTRMFMSQAIGRGTEIGAALNANVIIIDLDASAKVGDAYIEQETYYKVDGKTHELDFDAEISVIAANRGDIISAAGAPGVSTGGEKGGYGGAFSWLTVNALAITEQTEDANLDMHTIDISARQDLLLLNTARAFGANDDGGTGLNAGIAITKFKTNTLAISAADELIADKGLTIEAVDNSSVVTLAGTGTQGAKNGFSFGVALNLTDRTTIVDVSNVEASLDNEDDKGGMTIQALTSGSILAAGSASAQDREEEEEEPTPPADGTDTGDTDIAEPEVEVNTEETGAVDISSSLLGDQAGVVQAAAGNGDDGSGGSSGEKTLAFSGDFAGTFGDVLTGVTVDGLKMGDDFDADTTIGSKTSIEYGQASSVTAVAVDGIGISGSFGLSFIDHVTRTEVRNSEIYYFEDDAEDGAGATVISSEDISVFDVLVTGRAGHSQSNWGVAVSANFNSFKSDAETIVQDTHISNGQVPPFGGGGEGGGEGGEGGGEEGHCVDYVYCGNTYGRNVTISSNSAPKSIVTVLAARDALEAETNGSQQMEGASGLLKQAGELAQKPAEPETGSADPDDKKGKGFKGLSISIAPTVLNATSETKVIDTYILVDRDGALEGEEQQTGGKITVSSSATTDASINATAGTIGLSLAFTKTTSLVDLRRNAFLADGNGTIEILSNVHEIQDIQARVANDSRYKLAGVLSLRDALNRIEVDTAAGQASILNGGAGVTVAAKTEHDIQLTAIASDSTSLIFAGSAVVSLAQADTAILFGAETTAKSGNISIGASDVFTRYEALVVTTTGDFTAENITAALAEDAGTEAGGKPNRKKVKTPDADEETGNDNDTLAQSFTSLSDTAQEQATGAGEDAGAGAGVGDTDNDKKASTSPNFAISLNLDRHDSTVTALLGGTGVDAATERAFNLSGAVLTGAKASASITATTEIGSYRKLTATKAGSYTDTSIGFMASFSFGFSDIVTVANIGQTDTTGTIASVTLAAETKLAAPDTGDLTSAVTETATNITSSENTAGLLQNDLMPDPATELGRDAWSVTNRTEGKASAGFVLDVGAHVLDVTTNAGLVDGARLPTSGNLVVTAKTSGGLVVLRDIKVVDIIKPEDEDTDTPTDGTDTPAEDVTPTAADKERELGKIGLGGALQYVELQAETRAYLGALDASPSLELKNLTVTAENDVLVVATAKSFGGAEGFAFNAGIGIVNYTGDVSAQIDDRNALTVAKTTTLTAKDRARLFAFGGAGTQSGSAAFGLGAGLIFADRSAVAAITSGDLAYLHEDLEGSSGAEAGLNLGEAEITAETLGFSAAGSSAGAKGLSEEKRDRDAEDAGTDSGTDGEDEPAERIELPVALVGDRVDENSEGLGEQKTSDETPDENSKERAFGLALAADFSGVFGTNTAVSALSTEADVTVDTMTITANNKARAIMASGAAVGTGGSVGLAGSVSLSLVKTEVHALNVGGTRDASGGDIAIDATDRGDLIAAAVGRGGGGNQFSLVGSGALNLGRSTVMARNYDSTVENVGEMAVNAELKGTSLAVAGSLAKEVADEARRTKLAALAESELGDDAPETDTGGSDIGGEATGDGPDEEAGKSVGIGLVYASNIRRETVLSEVTRSTVQGDDLTVSAENARSITGIAAANGAHPDVAISASVVVNVLTQTTTANIRAYDGEREFGLRDNLNVRATNSATNTGQIGFSGGGSSFGLGLSGIALVDRRDTTAIMRNVMQDVYGGETDVDISATNSGTVSTKIVSGIVVGDAEEEASDDEEGDSGTSVAVNIPVGIITTRWDTLARSGDNEMRGIGDVRIRATENAIVSNRQEATTASGDHAGTVGVSYTNYNSDVVADMLEGDLIAASLDVKAETTSTLRSVAIRDGDAENALEFMVSVLRSTGETRAEVADANVAAGTIGIAATDATVHDLLTNGATLTSGTGITGGIAVNAYRRDLIARASNGQLSTTSGDLDITASSNINASSVVIGRNGGGGDFAGQANISWTTDSRDVIAETVATQLDVFGNVDITAERNDQFLSFQGTDTRSGSSVGTGLGVYKSHGITAARITGDASVAVRQSANLNASNATKVLQVAVGAAAGGDFAGVGSIGYVDFGQRPDELTKVTGEDRGLSLREHAANALNTAADKIEDVTNLSIAEFNFTRETRLIALVDVDNSPVEIGNDLNVVATDSRSTDTISGQLTLALNLGFVNRIIDKFAVTRNAEGKFRIKRRAPTASPPEDGSDDTESEYDPDEDSEGADAVDQMGDEPEVDDSDDGGDGDEGNGISFGVGISWVRFGGVVEAMIDLENAAGFNVVNTTSVTAGSNTNGLTGSAGAAFLGNAIGAGGAITRQVQLVRAGVMGNGRLDTGGLRIRGLSDNTVWAMAGALQIGEELSFGATLGLIDLNARTQALVGARADLRIGSGGLVLDARDDTRGVALGIAATGSVNGSGIAAAGGVIISRTAVDALIVGDASVRSVGEIETSAIRSQEMAGLAYQFAAGTAAGIGGGLGLAVDKGITRSVIADAEVVGDHDIAVIAKNNTKVVTSAVGAAYGGTYGVTGSVAITLKSDVVQAHIDNAKIIAGDSLLVTAINGGRLDSVGGGDESFFGSFDQITGGISFGGTAAIGVSIAVIKTTSNVDASIMNGSVVTAYTDGSVHNGITATDRSENGATYLDRESSKRHGVAVIADNSTELNTLAVTGALAAGAGIAVQIPVLLVKDTVSASIKQGDGGQETVVSSGSDVEVLAGNATRILTLSAVLGGGSSVGIGALNEMFLIDKNTTAYIEQANVTAVRDVAVRAVTPESVRTISAALGAGGYVGIAGVNQIGVTRSGTYAYVKDARVETGRDMEIDARAPRQMQQNAGSLGAGLVGIGASMVILNSTDEVVAETVSATSRSSAVDLIINGDLDIYAEAQTVPFGNYNGIQAPSGNGVIRVNQVVIGSGGGLVGVAGAGLLTQAHQTVIARLGAYTDVREGNTNNVSVRARQVYQQDVFVMTASGGFAAVGAAAVIASMRSAVLAEIDDAARVVANDQVTVDAYGERSFKGGVISAGGGAASFQGSAIFLTYGKRIRVTDEADDVEDGQSVIDDVQGDLDGDSFENNDDPDTNGTDESYSIGRGDALVRLFLGEVTTTRQSLDLNDSYSGTKRDTISTRIGAGANIEASDIIINAREGGTLEILAGGMSGGAISATHGVAVVRRGTAIETMVDAGAVLRTLSGDIHIGSLVDVDDGNPEAIAGSAGLIASGAAVADTRIGRSLLVDIANNVNISAKGRINIEAEEISVTKAKVTAVPVGIVGAGLAISNAFRESTVSIQLGNNSSGPHLDAPEISISAKRYGSVEAEVDVLSIGAVAIGATSAIARDTSSVTVNLGRTQLSGNVVTVNAINAGDVMADAKGNVGGLATTGINNANARRLSQTRILSSALEVEAHRFDLLATDNDEAFSGGRGRVYATSRSTNVGLATLGGSNSRALNESDVQVDLGLGRFEIVGDATIEARNQTDLEYLSKGLSASVIGIGTSFAQGIDRSSAQTEVSFGQWANIGGKIDIAATGQAYLFGNAVSGKGGIVTAYASDLRLVMDSVTNLIVSGVGVSAEEIVLRTDRRMDFESNSDSLSVSVADFGATRQINRVDSTSLLRLSTDLTAHRITVASNTEITKRAIDFNGVTGSFGGLNVSALASKTEVMNNAQIDLRSGALIKQISDHSDPRLDQGYVNITMNNRYDLTDRLTADMGGLVTLPRLVSNIIVGDLDDAATAANADITLNGAQITANGDVTLSNRADVLLNSEAYVRTYGLAGRAKVEATAVYHGNNVIDLDSGAITSRRGTVNVLVGEDLNGIQTVQQHAESRMHNRTVLPLNSDPVAQAETRQSNKINIDSGVTLIASGDVNLRSGNGFVDVYGYGYAIDAYSEAAQAVGNFFGSIIGADEVSLARESGTSTNTSLSGVAMNGTVVAGAYGTQRLIIDFASGVTANAVNDASDLEIAVTGDVDYSLEFDRNIGARIQSYINDLTSERNSYAQSSDIYDTLTNQIAALEARLAFMNTTGSGIVETDFLMLQNVVSQGGNVNLTGDYLIGEGAITANGDALIEVINNTSISLDIFNAEIPFVDAGEVRYNGVSVADNTDIVELGGQHVVALPLTVFSPEFTLTANTTDITPPQINLRSNYAGSSGPTADIYVRGDVENLNGGVTIRTEDGSVYVFGGNINAQSVSIDSGGDFFLAPSDPVTHLTQDPRALYQSLFDEYETYQNRVYNYMRNNPHLSEAQAAAALDFAGIRAPTTPLVIQPSQGAIQALGNIFIYANTININGLIRSGLTDWDLNIAASLDGVLNGYSPGRHQIYAPLRGTRVGTEVDETNVEIVGLNPVSTLPGDAHITGNVSVWYDADADVLDISPIVTKGGYIEISGKIISTGNGIIEAANGYGRLDIASDSSRDLRFGKIDLGPLGGVQGTIRLIDKNRPMPFFGSAAPGSPRNYVTTTYTQTADGVSHVSSNLNMLGVTPPTDHYSVLDNTALFFTTGIDRDVERTVTVRTTERRACILGGGCGTITDETVAVGSATIADEFFLENKPDVGYTRVAIGELDDAPYRFSSRQQELNKTSTDLTVGTPAWIIDSKVVLDALWTERHREYSRRENYTERRIFNHRLKADHDIGIEFDGHSTSRVSIDATGSVLFGQTVQNRTGNMMVTTGGDVLTLAPDVVLNTRDASITALNGSIGGVSPSSFRPRTYSITGPVTARDIYGRVTGAELQAGSEQYRNELIGAIEAENAPNVALFGGRDVVGITLTARNDIRVRQIDGDFLIGSNGVVSTFGHDVQIEAQGDIYAGPFGGKIEGGNVRLLAESGSIGVSPTNPYNLSDLVVNAQGRINAEALGDIVLTATEERMQVEQIRSLTGDVTLISDFSSVQDKDQRETADRRAQASLLAALWDELGLIENEALITASKAEVEAVVARIEAREDADYFDWWRELSTYSNKGELIDVADYDESFEIKISEVELNELLAKGYTQEKVDELMFKRNQDFHNQASEFAGSGFNMDYAFTVSDTRRGEIQSNLDAQKAASNPVVQRIVNDRTAEYFQWWSLLEVFDENGVSQGHEYYKDSLTPFVINEARHAAMVANGFTSEEIKQLESSRNEAFHAKAAEFGEAAFNASYVYAPDTAEIKQIIDSAYFTTTELEAAFRRDLILPVLDTQTVIEEPNVIGRNVTITSVRDIGEKIDPNIKLAGSKLTKAERITLFSAERADIQILSDRVIIGRNDDLDIEATGDVEISAARHAYVGSERDVNLLTFTASQDSRLKTSGAIIAVAGGQGVRGKDIALEASGGGIGQSDRALEVEVLTGGGIAARAAGDIYLIAPKSDLPIFEIYSLGHTSLTSVSGDVYSAAGTDAVDILAGSVSLTAGGLIGHSNGFDVELLEDNGRVDAEGDDGVDLEVRGGNIRVGRVGSIGGATNLRVVDGGITVVHPDSATSTAGMTGLYGETGLTLDLQGGIIETNSLWTTMGSAAFVDIIAKVEIGNLTRAANLNAPLLNLRLASGASFLNANITSFRDYSIGEVLAGTGDVTLSTSGSLDVIAGGIQASRLAMLTLGDVGLESDIRFHKDTEFGTGTVVEISAARNVEIHNGAELILHRNSTVTAGSRGAGSLIEVDGPTSIVTENSADLLLDVADNVVLSRVAADGNLGIAAGGSQVSIALATARKIDVDGAIGTEISGGYSADVIALKGKSVTARITDDHTQSTQLALLILNGDAQIDLALAGNVEIADLQNANGATTFDGSTAQLYFTGGVHSANGLKASAAEINILKGITISNGMINMEAVGGDLKMQPTSSLDAGSGQVRLAAAKDLILSRISSTYSGKGNAVELSADTIVSSQLTGVLSLIVVRDGTLSISGNSIGSVDGALTTKVARLVLTANSGAAYLIEEDNLELLGLAGTADQFDIFVNGDIELGGDTNLASDAIVILTSLNGDIDNLDANAIGLDGQVTLTAINGAIGSNGDHGLWVAQGTGASLNAVALGDIDVQAANALTLGHAVSKEGAVTLSAGAELTVDLLGAQKAPLLTGAVLAGAQIWGREEALQTLPIGAHPVQKSALYPVFAVLGDDAGDTGGGDTGGGDTGGGDTGGGDTGGGDTGGKGTTVPVRGGFIGVIQGMNDPRKPNQINDDGGKEDERGEDEDKPESGEDTGEGKPEDKPVPAFEKIVKFDQSRRPI